MLISNGRIRSAAQMIGNDIDPKNPLLAGKNKLSEKTISKAAKLYKKSKNAQRVLGQRAGKDIAIARKYAKQIKSVNDETTPSHPLEKKRTIAKASKRMMYRIDGADSLIKWGKSQKAVQKNAAIFGIAALVAQHLSNKPEKKNG